MINLLPVEEQKAIRSYYRSRLLRVALVLTILLFLISIIFLVPSYIIFSSKISSIEIQSAKLSSDDLVTAEESLREIEDFTQKIRDISPALDEVSAISNKIKMISDTKPTGLFIESINVPDSTNIDLRGITTSRQDVLDFVDALLAVPEVKAVDSPISNLIAEEGGSFVMKITFEDEKK